MALPATGTLPKVRLESLVLRTPGVAELAVSGMLREGFEALLTMARLPLAAPLDCGVKVTLKVLLWPAARVNGTVSPLRVKPVPEMLACVMLMLEPPELVRVPATVLGLLACTLPKLRLAGDEARAPAVTPLPVIGTASAALEASLVRVSALLTGPLDCGLKVTLNAALWPAARVKGRLRPVMVKPDPEKLACDTVTLELPELVRVSGKVWPWPTCTLPKVRLAGFEARVPGPVAMPETGTLTTEFEASLTTAILPLELPADCGANVMVKLLRSPAARVRGKVMPLILKPLPLIVAWLMVTLVLPELIRVAAWVWLAPIFTLPKARLVGETTS